MSHRAPGSRPRLLFLGQTLPFPPDSGVTIRSYHTLRLLAGAFDVTALCFARLRGDGGSETLAERVRALARFGEVSAFSLPQEHSRSRLAWDHFRSLAQGRVYTTFAYEAAPVRQQVARLAQERGFDLVHLDSLVLSAYLPLLRDARVVCTHHNVESALLRRRAAIEGGPFRRAYLRYQARLMEAEERHWCSACRLNVVVSEADQVELERIAPAASFAVVPNGVDLEAFTPEPGREESIVCTGETTWFPNRDALEFLCADVLPLIRAAGHSAPVRWIGRASDELRRDYARKYGVVLTGYLPDVRAEVRDAACYVVPLRVGGGTRVKILNAWAMGKAVVSTTVGAEGLEAVDGENILLRDDPPSFARAVSDVLRDGRLRRALGAAGRRTVEARYSWNRIGESLVTLYTTLLDAPQAARGVGGGVLQNDAGAR